MRTILVTGGAGFIGSNFIPWFIEHYPDYRVINMDLLTYAGDLKNLSEIAEHPRYHFVKGDISDRELVKDTFERYHITAVIHFAAESHVDNSIKNPDLFIRTNINGTFTLLDTAYKYWMSEPFIYRDEFADISPRFHHISTDEVYGSLGDSGLFTESTPYAPNSPYSASKASSDMLVRSYHHTFGLDTIITNCSNNYGAKQHDEKLIPTIIRKALAHEPIPIYGDGLNVRDWLYVTDHCRGIALAFTHGKRGESYNIGGKNEQTNIYIAKKICQILDELAPIVLGDITKYSELITFVEDRAGHDRRYAIDASKITDELGWYADEDFDSGILKTIQWYLKRYKA